MLFYKHEFYKQTEPQNWDRKNKRTHKENLLFGLANLKNESLDHDNNFKHIIGGGKRVGT